jgi:hypothetical protein
MRSLPARPAPQMLHRQADDRSTAKTPKTTGSVVSKSQAASRHPTSSQSQAAPTRAHGADEIVVVEQVVDLLGTELAAAVRVQNRSCRAPERDGVADRGRGQSSSNKTRLIPLRLTHADMGI